MAMKFFEQFSAGDRVEVDALTGGILRPGVNVHHGERGTVLEKRKGNWLDPVSTYLVEMDYPCDQTQSEISGRFLKRVTTEDDDSFDHEFLDVGASVTIRMYEQKRLAERTGSGGILLPDLDSECTYSEVAGTVLEWRAGRRRREPAQYLIKIESGEISWYSESSIIATSPQAQKTEHQMD
jgi:hypothetical protein